MISISQFCAIDRVDDIRKLSIHLWSAVKSVPMEDNDPIILRNQYTVIGDDLAP